MWSSEVCYLFSEVCCLIYGALLSALQEHFAGEKREFVQWFGKEKEREKFIAYHGTRSCLMLSKLRYEVS
jgi:hypothetical protein